MTLAERLGPGMVLVRFTSHRANDRMRRIIGETQNWYSWRHPGHLAECPVTKLEEVLKIKGITRARLREPEEWMKCWG